MAESSIPTTGRTLRCVVVTPERAVLDEWAEFVALPLYDGEVGILPGRAPLIGRLGMGELRIQRAGHIERFYLEGGFVQVRANTVTLLTSRAVPASELVPANVERDLQTASATLPKNDVEFAAKEAALQRARLQLRIAAHNGEAVAV